MEPGLSLARLSRAPSCMAWHGMAWHASTLSHSLTHTHTHPHTHTFLSPPFSPRLRRFHVASLLLLLLALSCPAISCTSLSLGSLPLPLGLVGDFTSHDLLSCPRAAQPVHLREPARITWLCSHGIAACILFSLLIIYTLRNILGLGGRYHCGITVQP